MVEEGKSALIKLVFLWTYNNSFADVSVPEKSNLKWFEVFWTNCEVSELKKLTIDGM